MTRVLELFCGAGGAGLGLHAAGVAPALGVDRDAEVVALRRALGFPTEVGDVRAADLGRFAGVDVLWASPPCQAFSTAQTRGPRAECDLERNLWPDTLEVVRGARPSWCIFENVGGSVAYVERAVLPTLRALYPQVSHQVLDAQHYGAPQTRRRLFVVAGPRPFRWPAATVARPRTMGEALPWLAHPRDPRNQGALYHHEGRAGSEPRWLLRPAPTVTTMEEKGTRASASSGWTFNGGPDRASDAAFLATGRRRLHWWECAMLQGFPGSTIGVWGELLGQRRTTVSTLYRGVGNAVSPPMAAALGRALLASG